MEAKSFIEQLNLIPHPEGGYFRETYRSKESTLNSDGEKRSQSTAIYFLLENENKSHFHRIKSDELWFFHQGQPIEILYFENAVLHTIQLGNDFQLGQVPQAVIPAHVWFASRLVGGKGYGLVSCTVAPGFDFLDFEMATKQNLLSEFPEYSEIIEEMTLD
jgi:hypothetical protein